MIDLCHTAILQVWKEFEVTLQGLNAYSNLAFEALMQSIADSNFLIKSNRRVK